MLRFDNLHGVAHIDVADPWQAIEACYERGWTDGLPVVPPTAPLVEAMLGAGPWSGDEMLLDEPARGRRVSAYKAAVNAVMAGCLPSYFPVVGATLKAMSEPQYSLHAIAASTGGAGTLVIVNGPIRHRLGVHSGANLFGPGFRANATIGRAVRLVMLNGLDATPGVLDKSTQGWPGKYSACFAEDEETSPWEPLHVSRGYDAGQSTVTIFAAESGHNLLNHASSAPEQLLTTFTDSMAAFGSFSNGRSVVVIAPEHMLHLERAGWSREQVQEFLYENTWRSLADLRRGGKIEDGSQLADGDETARVHRGQGPDDYLVLVGGGTAGGHSMFFPSWSRSRGASFVTREIPT